MESVPFSVVRDLLEDAGYVLLHRRKYPDEKDAFLYVFGHESALDVAFPVSARRVDVEHFDAIRTLLSQDGASEESSDEED
jgi:hypothetical protein